MPPVQLKEALELTAIQLKATASLATPAAGLGRVRYGTDKKFYGENEDGVEVPFGGMLFDASTKLTIASGAVTLTQNFHRIDTEANAASDDLVTLNGGTARQFYILRVEDAARVVTLKHGAGNMRMFGLNDIVLDATFKQVLIFYDGTTYNVISNVDMPNDLEAWGSYPDSDLYFAGQDAGGELYKVRGDEMRMHEVWDVTGGDLAADSSSEMNFIFYDATDRTVTLSNVLYGHSLKAKARQVSGGTGHKILLPVSCGWNGTSDRAILLNSATDWVIAVATSATNYEVMASNGVTYAAS